HSEVRRFAERGMTVIVVGRAGHAVVPGLLGQSAGSVRLVESVRDVAEIRVPEGCEVAVVLQPGVPVEKLEPIAEAVRARFGHVVPQHPSSYCYAAGDREASLAALAASCGVVLVAAPAGDGAPTLRVITGAGGVAYRVSAPGDILPSWVAGVACIGVTAAPGAAPGLVPGILRALSGLGPSVTVRQEVVTSAGGLAPPPVRAPMPMPRAVTEGNGDRDPHGRPRR
ncbi:MAG: hypothetical protein M3467_09750, partial [Actinomycetota bacterium]|nr:hypothetical protein [Actinomycetota bacterium]